jgi:polyhydroxyalkanoate synthesis regulator phasin
LDIKKSLLVMGAVAGIGLASVAGLGVASAATNGSQNGSIIDRIASKFNLNKEEVEAVFAEHRAEREAERQQRAEDKLAQAVEDGELTEEQKTKILAKLEELHTLREQWQDKTPEERRQARQELHASLQQWAEDNGVPLKYLHAGMPHHGPGMHKLMME